MKRPFAYFYMLSRFTERVCVPGPIGKNYTNIFSKEKIASFTFYLNLSYYVLF